MYQPNLAGTPWFLAAAGHCSAMQQLQLLYGACELEYADVPAAGFADHHLPSRQALLPYREGQQLVG
jgi:hypothetical protein